eukprot:7290823-Karenia_brevis.AAC.1
MPYDIGTDICAFPNVGAPMKPMLADIGTEFFAHSIGFPRCPGSIPQIGEPWKPTSSDICTNVSSPMSFLGHAGSNVGKNWYHQPNPCQLHVGTTLHVITDISAKGCLVEFAS